MDNTINRLPEAIDVAKTLPEIFSISMLQRKLRIGYHAARHLIEAMQQMGLIGQVDTATYRYPVDIYAIAAHEEETRKNEPMKTWKPVEAVQFIGNFDEVERFVGGDAEFRDGQLVVATRNGPLYANRNDYIFKNDKGKFESCDENLFLMNYSVKERTAEDGDK